MYPASSDGLNKESDEAIHFFTPAFDALNNFSAHRIEIWGEVFPTVEHAFQWKKFTATSPEIADLIENAGSPEAANRLAHAHNAELSGDWHEVKVSVMEELLRAKLAQHEDVREILKLTGDREIIEHSPEPTFWSQGRNGEGDNTMGKLWMKLRNELKTND